MPLLQVRDCPEDIYANLRSAAEAEHRSIAQQNVAILESYFKGTKSERSEKLETHEERTARKRALFAQLDTFGSAAIPPDMPDAAALVREDRDSR